MNDFVMILIQSSILIIALLLVRKLFLGKINPILQYSLWGIVGLRLFVPINIESVFSIFNVAKPQEIERVVAPVIYRVVQSGSVTQNVPTAPVAPVQTISNAINSVDPIANSISTSQWITGILFAVWVFGMAAMLIYTFVVNIKFYRYVKKNGVKENGYYICPNITSPCLMGRKIVLNTKAADDERAKQYALLHEQTHLKHWDNIWAALRTLTCIVYWFNPLVWLAATVCRKDQELACDYSVIKQIGEDNRKEYGQVLISLIRKNKALPALTTAMANNKKDIKQRLKLIANRPKMLKITAIILTLVVVTVSVIACTGAINKPTIEQNMERLSEYDWAALVFATFYDKPQVTEEITSTESFINVVFNASTDGEVSTHGMSFGLNPMDNDIKILKDAVLEYQNSNSTGPYVDVKTFSDYIGISYQMEGAYHLLKTDDGCIMQKKDKDTMGKLISDKTYAKLLDVLKKHVNTYILSIHSGGNAYSTLEYTGYKNSLPISPKQVAPYLNFIDYTESFEPIINGNRYTGKILAYDMNGNSVDLAMFSGRAPYDAFYYLEPGQYIIEYRFDPANPYAGESQNESQFFFGLNVGNSALSTLPYAEYIYSQTLKEHKEAPEPESSIILDKRTARNVTAYTHTGQLTTSGTEPKIGTIACASLPQGTKIYVPGYGYGIVEDMPAGYSESSEIDLDLFMESPAQCRSWGRKTGYTFYILK